MTPTGAYRFALCLALLGCGEGSTARLPADLEARLAKEGVVRRAAELRSW